MIGYETFLMSPDATYYDYNTGENFPLNFAELCRVSRDETMNLLTPQVIKKHPLSIATVAEYWTPHQVQHVEVAAYAAVTGFEEHDSKKLAVVGSLIAAPWARGWGVGFSTAEALIHLASAEQAVHEHEHHGFIAKCNEHGKKLTQKLGFEEHELVGGKTVMLKLL